MATADILVMEIARGHRLGAKPCDEAGIGSGFQNFDRHHALHGRVISAVDAAKAAPANLARDFVFSNLSDHAEGNGSIIPDAAWFIISDASAHAIIAGSEEAWPTSTRN